MYAKYSYVDKLKQPWNNIIQPIKDTQSDIQYNHIYNIIIYTIYIVILAVKYWFASSACLCKTSRIYPLPHCTQ